jgi:hypothetical protein
VRLLGVAVVSEALTAADGSHRIMGEKRQRDRTENKEKKKEKKERED